MTRNEQLLRRTIRLESLLRAEINDAFGPAGDHEAVECFSFDDIFHEYVRDLKAIFHMPEDLITSVAEDETR